MLVIDHFYLCEKQFSEGPLILGSGLTIWFTELLTLSLGGNVKIQTSPFKVRFWCPERRRDLTVVTVPRGPSCMPSASFTVYLCPSHLLLALGSGHLHLQVCATPDSLCLRALEETWEGGAVVGVIPSENWHNPQQMTDRKLVEKYPRFLAPWWKDSGCILPSLWETPGRLQPFPTWWPTY